MALLTKYRKETLIFGTGLLMLLIAGLWATVESITPESYYRKKAESIIQKDLQYLIELDSLEKSKIPVCEIIFNDDGEPIYWFGDNYLPLLIDLKTKIRGTKEGFYHFDNRSYYIIPIKDNNKYRLIPLSITYGAANNNAPFYVFAGRYSDTKGINLAAAKIYPTPPDDPDYLKILNSKGETAFYLTGFNEDFIRKPTRFWLVMSSLVGLLLLLGGGYFVLKNKYHISKTRVNILLIIIVVLIRLLMSYFNFPYEYGQIYFFSAETLAFHWLVPSLGDLLINILIFYILAFILYKELLHRLSIILFSKIRKRPYLSFLISTINIGIIIFILNTYIDIILEILRNSQLRLDFTNILDFLKNIYTQLLLAGIGSFLLGVYFLCSAFIRYNIMFIKYQNKNQFLQILLQLIFLFVIIIAFEGTININTFSFFVTVLLWATILYINGNKPLSRYNLVSYMALIGAFSVLLGAHIVDYNFTKKEQDMKVIVQKVFGEQDNRMYETYDQAVFQIDSDMDTIRQHFIEKRDPAQLIDNLNSQYFQKYFNNARLFFYVFDNNNKRIYPPEKSTYKNTQTVLNIHEADPPYLNKDRLGEAIGFQFYKARNNEAKMIYVAEPKLVIAENDTIRLQIQISPPPMPQNRRLPYFVQNSNNTTLQDISSEFEIALYENNKLTSTTSKLGFPSKIKTLEGDSLIQQQTTQYKNGRREAIYAFSTDRAIIIRYENLKWSDYTNTFSLIFFFIATATLILVSLLYLIMLFLGVRIPINIYTLQFRFQVLLLGLSSLIFVIVSGLLLVTIKNRFIDENRNMLHDEMKTLTGMIEYELKDLTNPETGRDTGLTISEALAFRLHKIPKAFAVDINIFNENNELILTSQPLLTQLKLSTGLLNYKAYEILAKQGLSEAFVKEKIRGIEYLSGFKAVRTENIGTRDNKGNSTFYINIPYFDRTEEVNRKTTNLLGFIISIVMIFVIIIALITIYLSHYLTAPLKQLQDKIRNTKLGISNKPMKYDRQDEIGEIVSSYNTMLKKLNESEKQLAQTERDLAWRQMAKQVAHEIKNPLTPMKLSVQYLTRTWNEKKPNIDVIFQKVTQTILSQIDTLTRIANNFSEFAKMPEAHRTNISLNTIITNIITLYTNHGNIHLKEEIPKEEFIIYADKDQISRVFTNLFNNAIQAIENKGNQDGTISITVEVIKNNAFITIQDNGCGMTEQVQKLAFEPNFSTKSSGMGLGLAMVKRIIEGNQGEIRLNSIEGEGTTFFIMLPRSSED